MPTISSFDGIVIRMYSEEHGPPHFHAIYAEHEAVIGITELQVTRGSLPGRRLARVLRWAVDHPAELMDNWDIVPLPGAPEASGAMARRARGAAAGDAPARHIRRWDDR